MNFDCFFRWLLCFSNVLMFSSVLGIDIATLRRKCDTLFVLDTSPNVQRRDFEIQKDFVAGIIKRTFTKDSRYGVISYNIDSNIKVPLLTFPSYSKFYDRIHSIKYKKKQKFWKFYSAYRTILKNTDNFNDNSRNQVIYFINSYTSNKDATDNIPINVLIDDLINRNVQLRILSIGLHNINNEIFKPIISSYVTSFERFEELLDAKTYQLLERSCENHVAGKRKYFLNLKVINMGSKQCQIMSSDTNGLKKDILQLQPSSHETLNLKELAFENPSIEIFVNCIGKELEENTAVLSYASFQESLNVMTVSDKRIDTIPVYQINLLVTNLLSKDVVLSWRFNKKTFDLMIPGYTSKNNFVINIYDEHKTPEEIVFFIKYKQQNDILINRHHRIFIELIEPFKQLFLFISSRSIPVVGNFSFSYAAFNMAASEDIFLQFSNHNGHELKNVVQDVYVSSFQQPLSMLAITENDFAIVRSFLPQKEGSKDLLFIGNLFEKKVPFGFYMHLKNLEDVKAYIQISVLNHNYTEVLNPFGSSKIYLQFSFLEIIPVVEIIAKYFIDGAAFDMYVNNRPIDILMLEKQDDIKEIVFSKEKAFKNHVFAHIRNDVQQTIRLVWSFNSTNNYLFNPIPHRFLVLTENSEKKYVFQFVTHKKLQSVKFHVEVKNNNAGDDSVTINDKQFYSAVTYPTLPKHPESFLIRSEGELFYVRINAINNLLNDVLLEWKIDDENTHVIPKSASKFIISGKNQQLISVKFKKVRQINKRNNNKKGNNIERVQFSALDVESHKKLFVNSLHSFSVNATDSQHDPVELVIKNPSYQYFFVFEAINQLTTNVYLNWSVKNETGNIIETEYPQHQEFFLRPLTRELYSVQFTSRESLNENQLGQILQFDAFDSSKDRVLINETTTFHVDLSKPKEKAVVLVISTTESYRRVADLAVVKITKDALTVRWKIPESSYNFQIQWWEMGENSYKQTIVVRSNELESDHHYYYYTVKNLFQGRHYVFNIRKNIRLTQDEILNVHLEEYNSPSIITVHGKNLSPKQIHLVWWTNKTADSTKIIVPRNNDIKTYFLFDKENLPSKVFIQLIEDKSMLLLLFEDNRDIFEISPKNYEKEVHLQIQKDQRIKIKQNYFAQLSFTNLALTYVKVVVQNNNGQTLHEQFISPGSSNVNNIVLKQLVSKFPSPYYVSAKSTTGKTLPLNKMFNLTIFPLLEKFEIPIYIADLELAEDLPQNFYLDVLIMNHWKNPVSVVLFSNGKINRYSIPPMQSHRLLEIENADEQPSFILGKVIDDKTDQHLINNNENSEIVLYLEKEYHPLRILIDNEGLVKKERIYFIEIEVSNERQEKSYLQYNRKVETLEPFEKLHQRFLLYNEKQPEPMLMSAFNLEENVLHLNSKTFLAFQPSSILTKKIILITDIPVKKFQLRLKFINLVSNSIDISMQFDSKKNQFLVPGKSLYVYNAKVLKDSKITIRAFFSGSKYKVRLNRTEEIKIKVDSGVQKLFYLGASGNQLDPSLVPYFYHFEIQNLNPEDIFVRWSEVDKERKMKVHSGEKEAYWQVMLGLDTPPNINLHFFGSKYQDLLFVNGKAYMELQPSKFGHLTSVTLDIGSTNRMYFAKLYYINTLPYEIEIKNDESNEILELPMYSSKQQQIQKTSSHQPTPVTIHAEVIGRNLYINGEKYGTKVKLSREPGKKYLFVGQEENSSIDQLLVKVIEIDIVIRNKRSFPIEVRIFDKQELLYKSIVLSNSTKTFQRTLTKNKEDSFLILQYLDAIEQKYLSLDGVINMVLPSRYVENVEYEIKRDILLDNAWKIEPSVYLLHTIIRNDMRDDIVLDFKNELYTVQKITLTHNSISQYILVFPLYRTQNLHIFGKVEDSGRKVLLNGRRFFNVSLSKYCCLNNPLDNDAKFVVNLFLGSKGLKFTEKSFTIHNQHSSKVQARWNFDFHKGNNMIESGQSVVFLLSHDASSLSNKISFEAFDLEERVTTNNKSIYTSTFGKSINEKIFIGNHRSSDGIVVVEFINRENEPIILKRTMLNGVTVHLSYVELASEERKRVYFSFSSGVYLYSITAHFEYSNKLLSINNRLSWQFSKYSQQLLRLYIQQYRSSNILLQYEIDCNNLYRDNITIVWNENGYLKRQEVKPGERILIRGRFYSDQMNSKMTFNASSNSKKLAMNGLDYFKIIASERNRIYFILITEKKERYITSPTRGLTLTVINNMNEDVNIFWHWPSVGGYVATVTANSEKLLSNICDNLEVIESISFTGVSLSGEKVNLNGKLIFSIQSNIKETVVVYIDSKEKVMTSETVNVGLYNTYPLPVNIDWQATDGVRRFLTMLPNETALIWDEVRRDINGGKTIAFHAWDMANKNNVLLNDRKLFNVLLLENKMDQNNITNIVITKDNTTTFYTLFIINKYSQNIRFVWSAFVATEDKGIIPITGEISIPKSEKSYEWFQYFVRKPLYVVFRSYNVDNGKQIYLNGKKFFNLTSRSDVIDTKRSSNEGVVSHDQKGVNDLVVGKAVQLQEYAVNLVVTNLLRVSVGIRWQINDDHKWKVLRPFQFNYLIHVKIMADELPSKIPFFSFDLPTRKNILTNDVKKFWIRPLTDHGGKKYHYIFISKEKTLRTYHFSFDNPTVENINVKWRTLARHGTFTVPKKQTNYTIVLNVSGGYRIQTIRMTASSKNHKEIMLNSNRRLFTRIPHRRVIKLDFYYRVFTFNNTFGETINLLANVKKYSQQIPPLTVIKIKILGKDIENNTINFKAVKLSNNLRVPINGYTITEINSKKSSATTFQIGGKTKTKSHYNLKLFLINNHKHSLSLIWRNSTFTVPENFNDEISLIFEYSKNVTFWAIDSVTNQPVYMNKKDALVFSPQKYIKYAQTIVFDGEISLYDYFYQLSIDNVNENEITISMENKQETLHIDVPADIRNFTISTPLIDFRSGIRKPMRVFATEKKTEIPFKVNGKDYFTIYPTLDPTDFNKVVTGNEELPALSYQYSLSITVTEGTPNANLQYVFQRENKISRIPRWAKNYKLVLPFKSYRPPKNITFKAFIEDSETPLFINGQIEGYMIPFYDMDESQNIIISKSTFHSVSGPSLEFDFPLFVANPNRDSVELVMENKFKKEKLKIPGNSEKYIIPMFLNDESMESPYEFQAYLNESLLKINGEKSFKFVDYKTDFLKIEKLAVTKVRVINTLSTTIFLKRETNSDEAIDEINPLQSKTIEFFKLKIENVKLSAFSSGGRNLSLNNNSFIMVNTTTDAAVPIVVRVLTLYYYLAFRNTELYEVEVKWSHANSAHRHIIRGRQIWSLFFENNEVDMSSFETYFTAERVWRDKPLYLNNRGVFSLKPYLDEKHRTSVLISDEPISLQSFLYIDLDVTNLLNTDVLLKWNTNESKLIPRKIYQLSLVIAIPQNRFKSRYVTFEAFPSDYSGIPVTLNNQRSLHLTPHKKKFKRAIIISSLDDIRTTYNLHLTVQNHHENTVMVRYKQIGTKLEYAMHVPSFYHRTFNLVFIRSKKKPVSVLFWAYDAVRLHKIQINNADGAQYQPRQREESMVIHVGNTVPRLSKNDINRQQVTSQNFPYYLGLHITNHVAEDATVFWRPTSTGDNASALVVPVSGSREVSKLILANWRAPWVAISAFDNQKKRLSINGKNIFYVRASLAKSIQFVHIDYPVHAKDIGNQRFVVVKVKNMSPFQVLLQWVEGDFPQSLLISKHESKEYSTVFKSQDIDSILIQGFDYQALVRGYEYSTRRPVFLNGQSEIRVFPSKRLSVTNILITNGKIQEKLYHFGFIVYNLLKDPVIIHYRINKGVRKVIKVFPHGVKTLESIVKKKSNIALKAYNARTTKSVLMNGQQNVNISTNHIRGKQVILIGKLAPAKNILKSYSLNLQIVNRNDKDFVLSWLQETTFKKLIIRSFNVTNYVAVFRAYNQPDPVQFSINEKVSAQVALLNGESKIYLLPRRNGFFAHLEVTYDDFFRPGEILSGDPASSNLCKDQVDILFLLDSSGSMKRVFPYAKQFINMLSETFYFSEDHTQIGLIDFSEEAVVQIPFNRYTDHSSFSADVSNLPFIGYRTRLDLALKQANNAFYGSRYGARKSAKKLMFLLTDGRTSKEKLLYRSLSNSLLAWHANINIVTIALSGVHQPDHVLLSYVTKSNTIYQIDDEADLLKSPFLNGLVFRYCKTWT